MAVARAAASRQRVEVETLRDEHSLTFARPDGSFVTETSLRPQRVRRSDGSWAAVDTTLRRNGDGTVSPAASTLDVRFSGGGSGPFAVMRDGSRQVGLRWPRALPEPMLSGDTATYRDVLPGVDLQVRADADSFTHLLVIRSAKAADNPAVSRIALDTELSGVSLRTEPGTGVVSAVDGSGAVVFEGPTPSMWDSRTTPPAEASPSRPSEGKQPADGPPPPPVEPREGAVAAEVSAGKLTLVPDAAMLDDPATVFPVFVDPTWTKKTASKTAWTVLRQTWPNNSYYKASSITSSDGNYGVMRAGYSDWESPTVRDRSLFSFDIKPFAYKHIYKATFSLSQQWSGAACGYTGARRTELRWLKQGFSTSTVWNTSWNTSGSGWGEVLGTSDAVQRYGHSCNPRKVEFNVTGKLAQLTAKGTGGLNLGLRAKNESDRYGWKRFKNDAALSIEYNSKPNAARDLKVTGKACASGAGRPYVTTATPTFTATASDPDAGQQALTTRFYYWPQGQARGTAYAQGTSANPAPVTSAATPALASGTTYVFQAYTFDNVNDGTWSGTCEFTADFVRPNGASDITSTDGVYPEYNPANPNQPGSGGVGFTGTLRVHAPASLPADVAYYRWTLNSAVVPDKSARVSANATTKNADITVRPRKDGVNVVRVWSEDLAENLSNAPVTYEFKVASGSGPAAEWTFDEASGSAGDVTGHGNTAALGGSAGRTPGRAGVGTALSLNGTTGYAATAGTVTQPHPTTGVPVPVAPNGSFTATAWARLSATGGGVGNVVSYDGANNHALRLAYNGGDNRWVYRVVPTDTAGAPGSTLTSTSAAVSGKWTHLAMVWDAPALQMRLYVNGVLEATHSTTAAWAPHSNGSLLSIGRTRTGAGTFGQFLNGAVDDVQVYSFVATAGELAELAKPLAPLVTFPGGSTATVGDQVQVRFDARGDNNVTHIKYSVNSATLSQTVALASAGGIATVTVPATAAGTMTVFAASQAGAGGPVGPHENATIEVLGSAAISGRIFDAITLLPQPDAEVRLEPGGATVITGANGIYSFTGLIPGDYVVAASFGGGCGIAASTEVTVTTASEVYLYMEPATDSFGYGCQVFDQPFTPVTGTALPLNGDNNVTQVTLPFAFPFYGQSFTSAWVDTNGMLTFENPGSSRPNNSTTIPNAAAPNAVIAPFWDDLVVDGAAGIHTDTVVSPFRQYIVEWRNAHRAGNTAERITAQLTLDESGAIFFSYTGLSTTSDPERGGEAVTGIESPGGMVGLQYSFLDPVLADDKAVAFLPPMLSNPIQLVDLTGTVTDAATGTAQPGAVVTVEQTGQTVTADASGNYAFADLEAGSYTVSALKGEHCGKVLHLDVDLYEPSDVDLPLTPLADAHGNTCHSGSITFTPANDAVLPLTGDDGKTQVTVPFPVSLYGQSYTTAWVDIDGLVAFAPYTGTPWQPAELPSVEQQGQPNAAVYAFWEDWVVDASASVRTATTGSAPNRQFVVEWRNVHSWAEPSARVTFEVVFHEGGDIQVAWNDIDPASDRERGSLGAVAIENADGTIALVHSYKQTVLASGHGVRFTPGPAPIGDISGTVSCAGAPASGVSVKVAGRTATTASDGTYTFADVPGGPYTILATPGAGSGCYGTAAEPVTVSANQASVVDFDLPASSGTRYTVTEGPRTFVPANATVLPNSGDDGITQVTLPFPAKLYGQSYNTAWVATDGVLSFEEITNQPWDPWPLPSEWDSNHPNTAVYPFWHDWVVDASASIRTATTGTAPNRQFIVEWRNVLSFQDTANTRVSFEVILHEQGDIEIVWDGVDVNFYEQGGEATVGVENADGTLAVQYTYRHPVIVNGRGLLLHPVTS
ncbi:carboxypeptidase regulatory-like domain-containing protein [Phytohabitans kaempferiae]|uniref:Carboxypeptidase regulatory-like domain-containing protein n=1 Tax=Phytohabitans kaempferiae TaxID=1620943 RepID=A0ABV6M2Y2_9ACTN